MIKRIFSVAFGLFALTAVSSHADDAEDRENIWEFTRQYQNFVAYIERENWDRVSKHISESTRCGVGDENCLDNIKAGCREDALMWLRMGCVVDDQHKDKGKLYCNTPTDLVQSLDLSKIVLRNNSSFGFVFDINTKLMTATILMCGGE